MILPLLGLLIGALIGVLRAKSKSGKPADLVHWGIVFGIIGALIGLIALIAISRLS